MLASLFQQQSQPKSELVPPSAIGPGYSLSPTTLGTLRDYFKPTPNDSSDPGAGDLFSNPDSSYWKTGCSIDMNDPRFAGNFLSGFHGPGGEAWGEVRKRYGDGGFVDPSSGLTFIQGGGSATEPGYSIAHPYNGQGRPTGSLFDANTGKYLRETSFDPPDKEA